MAHLMASVSSLGLYGQSMLLITTLALDLYSCGLEKGFDVLFSFPGLGSLVSSNKLVHELFGTS